MSGAARMQPHIGRPTDLDLQIRRYQHKERICLGFKAGRAGQACRARKGKFISTDPGNRHCTYCAGWSE